MESILSAWLIWLIAAAILVIIELLTTTYAALCLVGGCLAAMICAISSTSGFIIMRFTPKGLSVASLHARIWSLR